ncbi:MAG: Ig-like domain-containing protein [Ignavibacteriota bacterium]
MAAGKPLAFPPVAGNQWAQAFFNAPVTLNPLGNAAVYGGTTIDPSSIDLDPNTAGVQSSFAVYGGSFAVVGQSVQFTPSAGFNGTTQCAYTLTDRKGNLSNVAYLAVTVAPSPTTAAVLNPSKPAPMGGVRSRAV